MNSRITRREVAKQFIIAIELLLEWIEQKEKSNGESMDKDVGEDSIETQLLTAPEVARILNISQRSCGDEGDNKRRFWKDYRNCQEKRD